MTERDMISASPDPLDEIEPPSDDLRALFAGERDVSAADRIAIRSKLAASVGAPAPVAATTTAIATSKLAWIAAAVIAAAAGVWWATHRTPDAPPPSSAPRIETAAQPTSAQPTSAQPTSAQPTSAQPTSAPEPTSAAQPSPAAAPPPKPMPRAASPSQAELLAKAWQVLATDPAQALELVELDARTHPHGALAEERDALRIQALVAVGRTDDARALATTFLATHPQSVHRKRIEAAVKEAP